MFKIFLQKAGHALLSVTGIKQRGGQLRAGFEAAGNGRRLGQWGMASAGPNTQLLGALSALRTRSREVIRNTPHAGSAIESYVANMVGKGIIPRWQIADQPDIKKQIQALWNRWVEEADADGQMDFYGLQALIARSMNRHEYLTVSSKASMSAGDGYLILTLRN